MHFWCFSENNFQFRYFTMVSIFAQSLSASILFSQVLVNKFVSENIVQDFSSHSPPRIYANCSHRYEVVYVLFLFLWKSMLMNILSRQLIVNINIFSIVFIQISLYFCLCCLYPCRILWVAYVQCELSFILFNVIKALPREVFLI